MDLEGQRRTRTRDNPMAIVIVFDLGNDRDAFVVGDEPAGKFGNKLKKWSKVSAQASGLVLSWSRLSILSFKK